jgi:hypothetical protein
MHKRIAELAAVVCVAMAAGAFADEKNMAQSSADQIQADVKPVARKAADTMPATAPRPAADDVGADAQAGEKLQGFKKAEGGPDGEPASSGAAAQPKPAQEAKEDPVAAATAAAMKEANAKLPPVPMPEVDKRLADLPELPEAKLVYATDFGKGVGPEWSWRRLSTSPTGQRYLGDLTNAEVALSVKGLPEHAYLKIAFDVHAMRSMDGLAHSEIISLTLDRGPVVLRTNFCNDKGTGARERQSYPGQYPVDSFKARTGAVAQGSLGLGFSSYGSLNDSTYRIEMVVPHSSDSVVLTFIGHNIQDASDEAWGIDNVEVSVLPRGRELSEQQVKTLIDMLDEKDSLTAHQAMLALISGGEPALGQLRKKAGITPRKVNAQAADLIAQLDDDDWRVRKEATEGLIDMGIPARRDLAEAYARAESQEVRARVQYVLKMLGVRPVAAVDRDAKPGEFRAKMAREILEFGLADQVRK